MSLMRTTVGDLKGAIQDVPDDYEVWIEYPKRYGLANPTIIHNAFDDQDFIPSMSLGSDISNNKKFFICHHY
jgi:hypothetical protein